MTLNIYTLIEVVSYILQNISSSSEQQKVLSLERISQVVFFITGEVGRGNYCIFRFRLSTHLPFPIHPPPILSRLLFLYNLVFRDQL